MNDTRGSLWRRWDLHIHTPFSILNNGFGNDFDIYVQNIFKVAISKDIAVIGITSQLRDIKKL
jgi:predicted metal-dependent phosphoesterase TrpH